MIRGVVKKYKQPLAYYFCSGSTKAIDLKAQIKEIITALQKTGLKVVTTVCNQGASNVAAIKEIIIFGPFLKVPANEKKWYGSLELAIWSDS